MGASRGTSSQQQRPTGPNTPYGVRRPSDSGASGYRLGSPDQQRRPAPQVSYEGSQPSAGEFDFRRRSQQSSAPSRPSSGYTFGAPQDTGSTQTQSSYLAQGQDSSGEIARPTSMVKEVRKAGDQMFNQALGINTEGADESAVKVPGVSTSRMAGDILQGFGDKLGEQLDPTKAVEEETDPTRYGIGAPAKPDARYTASAAAPFG